MRWRWCGRVIPAWMVFLALSAAAGAQSPGNPEIPLDALKAALVAAHDLPAAEQGFRGGSAKLTDAKQQLLSWVEKNLESVPQSGDETTLAASLNDVLRRAGLFCPPTDDSVCTDSKGASNGLGYLGALRLGKQSEGRYLTLITSVRIECGEDQSAYVYAWQGGHWTRVLADERTDYDKDHYNPLMISSVLVAAAPDDPNAPKPPSPVVASLGTGTGCWSAWHTVTYRLWRLAAGRPAGAPLVDRTEYAYTFGSGPDAYLRPHDLLVEFLSASIDTTVWVRPVIRHYRLADDGTVARIDPVALSPRDFVDEWLRHPGEESAAWSDIAARPALRRWHDKLTAGQSQDGAVFGEFEDPAMRRCRTDPTLWQVGIAVDGEETAGDKAASPLYFLVRWLPPYHFTLMDIGAQPRKDCDEDVDTRDDLGTLFPSND